MIQSKKGLSLKWGLLAIMALCWIVPIAVIFLYSSYAISNNVQERIQDTITTSVDIAFQDIKNKLGSAMDASRASSYDNTIKYAYNKYLNDSDYVTLNSSVRDYLLKQYGYDSSFNATFLLFPYAPDTAICYVNNRTNPEGENINRQKYLDNIHPQVLDMYPGLGTRIGFIKSEQGLYMVRNIVSSNFKPYAVIVMECNQNTMYESVRSIVWLKNASVSIDDNLCSVTGGVAPQISSYDGVRYDSANGSYTIQVSDSLSGHNVELNVVSDSASLIDEFPDVANLLPLFAVFGILLFLLVLWAYYHYVSHPMDALVDAAGHMEAGERGYTVKMAPGSREFRYLTERFNSMSAQLKYQFELSYQEQLALQDARVKALRSQINPHFLNNTLEVISWAARIAKDDKVCRMIEALSTMLDAATARGGRARGSVRQELAYADAYLYILSERFGERLTIKKEIASETLKALVPCLILQPIVENAIEHGIALRQKGEITLRSIIQEDTLIIEVENDGRISKADKKSIDRLLSWDTEETDDNRECIGIRNVNRRLKILYGEEGGLTITEITAGKVLARIVIPHVEFEK